ncbi:Diacylglycerol acyltransferase/mycolyltransferase Ag85A precursor [Actinomadura rubteroloni]|uniref:Diacylglycerol acyltransferase/mycolyltransferase Ag85A n=1 Tax=Actinomadura rubteroloni TaxID=1926885 RepID=A0A2P4UBU0_9ACTN|nr:alpha/beta hydrolase-fold protein [Actinomadura rubteroloni]POM22521.1 Diacylglycerol acyltransferase/mycolyltransferase Ag85A precursor [Actinomadura rubteroloni]
MTLSVTVRPRVRWRRSLAASAVGAALAAGAGVVAVVPVSAAGFTAADTGAKITGEQQVADGEVDITISSPSLGKSVKTRLLLPKGWTRGSSTKYPVLYAFHGGQDNYTSWTKNTDIEDWARKYNVLVVMPEGENGSYTDWYNYGKGGTPKWETFHTTEVRELVERNYGASSVAAAIGNSSGAQGAMSYAARHQGIFKYVASLSGTLSMRSPGMPAMLMFTNAGNGQDPYAIWGIPWADDANWKAHDPASLVDKLRGTGIFFSSGTTGRPGPGDPNVAPWDIGLLSEIAIGSDNKEFQKKLDEAKVPYTAHIYGDGRHNWPAWIREATFIWPTLMKSIGADPVQ